jgi:hypothetical protein
MNEEFVGTARLIATALAGHEPDYRAFLARRTSTSGYFTSFVRITIG